MSSTSTYAVGIIGAGVCGTATAYLLRCFSDVGPVALIEKESEAAAINSARWNNSQTLHCGDIETNYPLAKAKRVKAAADLVRRYLQRHDAAGELHTCYHKMVIGVGADECERLRRRFEDLREFFPELALIERQRIAELEPAVVAGRDPAEELCALYSPEGHTVDFGRLARSFLQRAEESQGPLDTFFGRGVVAVEAIDGGKGGYRLRLSDGQEMRVRFLVVAAGGHSLLLAKRLGYGEHLGLLSVAGSFFHADGLLNGKVYTMQIPGLPFAAAHGDPEVHDPTQTRFGPTAKPLPLLERHRWRSCADYCRTLDFNWATAASLCRILGQSVVMRFAARNACYELPWIGKRLFLPQLRKIVPRLQAHDIHRAKGFGGVRPQIVDTRARDLDLGEAKLHGRNACFNVTPSPGASVCLRSAHDDVMAIADALEDVHFDAVAFETALGPAPAAMA